MPSDPFFLAYQELGNSGNQESEQEAGNPFEEEVIPEGENPEASEAQETQGTPATGSETSQGTVVPGLPTDSAPESDGWLGGINPLYALIILPFLLIGLFLFARRRKNSARRKQARGYRKKVSPNFDNEVVDEAIELVDSAESGMAGAAAGIAATAGAAGAAVSRFADDTDENLPLEPQSEFDDEFGDFGFDDDHKPKPEDIPDVLETDMSSGLELAHEPEAALEHPLNEEFEIELSEEGFNFINEGVKEEENFPEPVAAEASDLEFDMEDKLEFDSEADAVEPVTEIAPVVALESGDEGEIEFDLDEDLEFDMDEEVAPVALESDELLVVEEAEEVEAIDELDFDDIDDKLEFELEEEPAVAEASELVAENAIELVGELEEIEEPQAADLLEAAAVTAPVAAIAGFVAGGDNITDDLDDDLSFDGEEGLQLDGDVPEEIAEAPVEILDIRLEDDDFQLSDSNLLLADESEGVVASLGEWLGEPESVDTVVPEASEGDDIQLDEAEELSLGDDLNLAEDDEFQLDEPGEFQLQSDVRDEVDELSLDDADGLELEETPVTAEVEEVEAVEADEFDLSDGFDEFSFDDDQAVAAELDSAKSSDEPELEPVGASQEDDLILSDSDASISHEYEPAHFETTDEAEQMEVAASASDTELPVAAAAAGIAAIGAAGAHALSSDAPAEIDNADMVALREQNERLASESLQLREQLAEAQLTAKPEPENDKLPELESELETLRAKLDTANAEKAEAGEQAAELETMRAKVDAADAEKAEAAEQAAELETLRAKVDAVDAEKSEVERQAAESRAKLESTRQEVEVARAEVPPEAEKDWQEKLARLEEDLNEQRTQGESVFSQLATARKQLASTQLADGTGLDVSNASAIAKKLKYKSEKLRKVKAKLREKLDLIEELKSRTDVSGNQLALAEDSGSAEKQAELAKENDGLYDEISDLKLQLENSEAEFKKAKSYQEKATSKLEALHNKSVAFESELSAAQAIVPEEVQNELNELKATVETAKSEVPTETLDELKSLHAKVESHKTVLAEAQSAVPDTAQQQLDQLNAAIETQKTELAAAKAELREAKSAKPEVPPETLEELKQLRSAAGKQQADLQTAKAELDKTRKVVATTKAEVPAETLSELKQLRASVQSHSEELNKAKSAVPEKALQQLNQLKAEVETQKSAAAIAQEKVQAVEAKVAKAGSQVPVETLAELKELRSGLATAKTQLTIAETRIPENVEAEMVNLRGLAKQTKEAKVNFEKADAEKQELLVEVKSLKDSAASAESQFQQRLAKHEEEVVAKYESKPPEVDVTKFEQRIVSLKSEKELLATQVAEAVRDAEEKRRALSRLESHQQKLVKEIESAQAETERSSQMSDELRQLNQQTKEQKTLIARLERKIATAEAKAEKAAAKAAAAKKTTRKSAAGKSSAGSGLQKTVSRATDHDDLKVISGIGPVFEKRLHKAGIKTFAQIAEWTKDDIESFKSKLDALRIAEDNWVGQAKKLASRS